MWDKYSTQTCLHESVSLELLEIHLNAWNYETPNASFLDLRFLLQLTLEDYIFHIIYYLLSGSVRSENVGIL